MMLAYHEFSRLLERDVYSLPAESFRRHLGYVRMQNEIDHCLTFDDGCISQFEIAAPLLHEAGISGRFFITSSWVGLLPSAMNWGHLHELQAAGHCIGSHTHTHPLLTSCSTTALQKELITSKHVLEQNLGQAIDSISMPGGRLDARVLAECYEAGYKHVYTSRVGEYRKADNTIPEVIGRFVVRRATSDRTITGYLNGDPRVYRRLQMESALKSFAKRITGDSVYQRLWRSALRSGAYGS